MDAPVSNGSVGVPIQSQTKQDPINICDVKNVDVDMGEDKAADNRSTGYQPDNEIHFGSKQTGKNLQDSNSFNRIGQKVEPYGGLSTKPNADRKFLCPVSQRERKAKADLALTGRDPKTVDEEELWSHLDSALAYLGDTRNAGNPDASCEVLCNMLSQKPSGTSGEIVASASKLARFSVKSPPIKESYKAPLTRLKSRPWRKIFPFLKLSRELRDVIYAYLVTAGEVRIKAENMLRARSDEGQLAWQLLSGLLRVSFQMHEEAAKVFFQKNFIVFHADARNARRLARADSVLGAQMQKYAKSVSVIFDGDDHDSIQSRFAEELWTYKTLQKAVDLAGTPIELQCWVQCPRFDDASRTSSSAWSSLQSYPNGITGHDHLDTEPGLFGADEAKAVHRIGTLGMLDVACPVPYWRKVLEKVLSCTSLQHLELGLQSSSCPESCEWFDAAVLRPFGTSQLPESLRSIDIAGYVSEMDQTMLSMTLLLQIDDSYLGVKVSYKSQPALRTPKALLNRLHMLQRSKDFNGQIDLESAEIIEMIAANGHEEAENLS